MDLAHKMLNVASATADDGGAAILDLARAYLGEVVTFDAGEVVLRAAARVERLTLLGGRPGLAANDLLEHMARRSQVLRIDEIHELAHLPGAQAAMAERDLRSLLVLPVVAGDLRLGAVVLGARKPYAFVGVSQRTFGPLMAMVGISLRNALALGVAAPDREATGAADHNECQREIASLKDDLVRARDALRDQQTELAQVRASERTEREQSAGELDVLRKRLAEVDDAFEAAARLETELAGAREQLAHLAVERDRMRAELAETRRPAAGPPPANVTPESPPSAPAAPPLPEPSVGPAQPSSPSEVAAPAQTRVRRRHRRR